MKKLISFKMNNKLLKFFTNWQKKRIKDKIEKILVTFATQLDRLITELDQYQENFLDIEPEIKEVVGENADLVSKLKTAVLSEQDEIGVAILNEILTKRNKITSFSQSIEKAEEQAEYIIKFTEEKVEEVKNKIQNNKYVFTYKEIQEIEIYLEKLTQKARSIRDKLEKQQKISKLKSEIQVALVQIPLDKSEQNNVHATYEAMKKFFKSPTP